MLRLAHLTLCLASGLRGCWGPYPVCEGPEKRSYERSIVVVESEALATALDDDRLSLAECRVFCEGVIDPDRDPKGSLEGCAVHWPQDAGQQTEIACNVSYSLGCRG